MTPPVMPERPNVIVQMRAALQAAREAGVDDAGMDEILRAWTEEVQRVNEGERRVTDAEIRASEAAPPSMLQQRLGGIAALVKDIPGVEAVQAAGRVYKQARQGQPTSYREELGDLERVQRDTPKVEIPYFPDLGPGSLNRLAGGGIAAAALPIKSPALAGAAYGGLLNALGSDPDQSIGERAGKAAVGAAVGGAVGKVADVASTGIRAKFAKPLGESLDDLKLAREADAGPLYEFALAQGKGGATRTPEIATFLARPDVNDIVLGLQGLDEFAQVAPDDPRMLDAVYKVLSDQQKTVGKQLAVTEPGKPNLGRFTERQIRGVKREALDAMDTGMSMYRPATQAYARGSRAIEGLKRGQRAAAIETGSGSNPENLAKFGRQSLLDFLESGGDDVSDEAVEGVLGFGRRKLEQAGPTGLLNPMRGMARNFLLDGGDLLRAIEGTAGENAAEPLVRQTLLDYLRRTGTAAATPNLGDR